MSKGHKIVALTASSLFFLTVFLFSGLCPCGAADALFGGTWTGAAVVALFLVAMQYLVWLAARHFNLIFYAVSFIPAICLWTALCIWSVPPHFSLWLALLFAAADILLPESRIPESRTTTQGWLGCCLLLVLASMIPPLLKYACGF